MKIEQRHREAAVAWLRQTGYPSRVAEADMIERGEYDEHSLPQAFARFEASLTKRDDVQRVTEAIASGQEPLGAEFTAVWSHRPIGEAAMTEEPVCRGDLLLGTACRRCARCKAERERLRSLAQQVEEMGVRAAKQKEACNTVCKAEADDYEARISSLEAKLASVREKLREITEECRNTGLPNEIVADRVIDRVECSALEALSLLGGE
jgi:hypothetical protein